MSRKYGLIIFGASGLTGKCTVMELVKLMQNKKIESIPWAIGGRSGQKLKQILKEVSTETGQDLRHIETIEADVQNAKSLQNMARQTNVLITCVGPYRFFGEPVVRACVAEGTNYIDTSGEPQYLEEMQFQYHQKALDKNIYIVGSCGFNIPSALGTALLQQKFEGDLNSVEMYLEFTNKEDKPWKCNFGTWQSAIYGVAHANELRDLRKTFNTKPLPKAAFKLRNRGNFAYSDVVNGWCIPLTSADSSIIKRSQYYFFHEEQKRPAQIRAYYKTGSLYSNIKFSLVLLTFETLAKFKAGRYLLEKFPEFFSLGFFTNRGISRDEMDDVEYKFTLRGEGWQTKLARPTDQHSEPPNNSMDVVVTGRNPVYGATCIMLIQAAYTILKEANKMPLTGGVYPPGAAFARTSIIDRLNESGQLFQVKPHPLAQNVCVSQSAVIGLREKQDDDSAGLASDVLLAIREETGVFNKYQFPPADESCGQEGRSKAHGMEFVRESSSGKEETREKAAA